MTAIALNRPKALTIMEFIFYCVKYKINTGYVTQYELHLSRNNVEQRNKGKLLGHRVRNLEKAFY